MSLLKYYKHNPKDKLTEGIMINALRYFIMGERNYMAFCPRVHNFFGMKSESDVIAINPNGYLFEFEVKLTKADFLKDKDKIISINRKRINKHKLYEQGGGSAMFYFVAPKGILTIDDIPEWAGLIEVTTREYPKYGTLLVCNNVKNGKKLNKRKATDKEIAKLLRLLSFKTT